MYGWRARIGLIVPASNSTNEPEWQKVMPEGVSLHTARMPLEAVTEGGLSEMADTATAAAERLSQVNVDVVAYGCTTGSLIKGHKYAEKLEAKLSKSANAEAITTALSVERALDSMDVESVSIATPYNETLNQREVEFLEEGGFSVDNITGRGLEDNLEIGDLEPRQAYIQGHKSSSGEEGALFISCTNYRTFEIIQALEMDLGKPVITSNQATLWDSLNSLGLPDPQMKLGQLFEDV